MNANLMVIQCVLSLYLHQKAPKRWKGLKVYRNTNTKAIKALIQSLNFEKTQTTETVYNEQLITNACNTHIPKR